MIFGQCFAQHCARLAVGPETDRSTALGARSIMNSGPVRENTAPAGSAPSEGPLLRLEEFLPHRLNVLSSLVSQALTRVYGRYGIGIPEWRGGGPVGGEGGPAGQGGGG